MSTEKSDTLIHAVPADWARAGACQMRRNIRHMYASSVSAPETFWAEHGKRIDWIKPFTKVKNTCFRAWQGFDQMVRGWHHERVDELHRPASCRSVPTRLRSSGRATIPVNPGISLIEQLHDHVCRFANVLKMHGVEKGHTVTIYLPMIPEAAYAMLACARIGAVHSIVFGGFSPDALAGRIEGCQSKIVITADEGLRGGRKVPLKVNADQAVKKAPGIVKTMIVVKRTGGPIDWIDGRDVWYDGRDGEGVADMPRRSK